MKKRNKIVAFLLVLGLMFSLCACNDKDDSGKTPPPPAPPAPPATVDVGDYARVWVSGNCMLDLAAGTLTGSDFDDFEVKSITGGKANAVITCTADENEYTLTLNTDGALDMKDGDETVVYTFMAAPAEFSGAWLSSDPYAAFYYTVSDNLNANGKFDWATIGRFDGERYTGTAVTKFAFTADGAPTLIFVDLRYSTYLEDYYEHTKIYYVGSALKVLDEYGDVYNLTPYGDCFDKTASYFDAKEHTFSFDGGKIVYNGASADYQLKANANGSGLSFKAGDVDYFLQYCCDGLRLVTASEKIAVALYDPALIVGQWSNEDNTHTAVIEKDNAVTFDGTEYPLSLHAVSGGFCYSFTVGSVTYTINFISGIDAAFEMKANGVSEGYYILNSAKSLFVNVYTDNLNTFTIGYNYTIQYEGGQSRAGGFTYLPDFE
ncbi:MAG: hypothetical protein K2M95_07400, partial [Clostridiales bacterium]|nr:hypothetical protein [Clostridiales bacterium]